MKQGGRMNKANVRKTLDRLAYASLVLDICIAVITTLSIFGLTKSRVFLIPINYLLTIVVILSLAMFLLLLLLRAKERQIPETESGSRATQK